MCARKEMRFVCKFTRMHVRYVYFRVELHCPVFMKTLKKKYKKNKMNLPSSYISIFHSVQVRVITSEVSLSFYLYHLGIEVVAVFQGMNMECDVSWHLEKFPFTSIRKSVSYKQNV